MTSVHLIEHYYKNPNPHIPVDWKLHLTLKMYKKIMNKSSMERIIRESLFELPGFAPLYKDVTDDPEKYAEALGLK